MGIYDIFAGSQTQDVRSIAPRRGVSAAHHARVGNAFYECLTRLFTRFTATSLDEAQSCRCLHHATPPRPCWQTGAGRGWGAGARGWGKEEGLEGAELL